MKTLRAAGFRPTDTAAAVARQLGRPVDEVLAQTGLSAPGDALSSRALDAPFTFPDGFAPAQGPAQAPTPGASDAPASAGSPGLLRMRLEGELPSSDVAAGWGIPDDPAQFPHEGAFLGAVRKALVQPGRVDSVERAWELAERLGLRAHVSGDTTVNLVFDIIQATSRRKGAAGAARAIGEALKAPLSETPKKAGDPLPAQVDTSGLPRDPADYPHEGAFFKALRTALLQPGLVDSPARVEELSERLGIAQHVAPDDDAGQYLFTMLQALRRRVGAGRVTQTIAEALGG